LAEDDICNLGKEPYNVQQMPWRGQRAKTILGTAETGGEKRKRRPVSGDQVWVGGRGGSVTRQTNKSAFGGGEGWYEKNRLRELKRRPTALNPHDRGGERLRVSQQTLAKKIWGKESSVIRKKLYEGKGTTFCHLKKCSSHALVGYRRFSSKRALAHMKKPKPVYRWGCAWPVSRMREAGPRKKKEIGEDFWT